MEYSKAMMCLMYGTKGYPSHIVTGSTGRGYHSMKLFCFDVCYSFAENDSIFRKKEANSFGVPGNKPTKT